MIVDISVGIIAFAFVILAIYATIILHKVIEMLKASKRAMVNIDHISEEGKKLVKNTNDLALDFKEKSEAMNFFFRPLKTLNKKKTDSKHLQAEKIAEIIHFALESMALFNKLKKKK